VIASLQAVGAQAQPQAARRQSSAADADGRWESRSRESHEPTASARGALKKKVTDLGVVGWFLGAQKSTRAGQVCFRDFFIVFLNSPHRNTSKNAIKNKIEKKSVLDFLVDFFENFSTRFVCKTFFVVLLNSHRQETPKNAIKRKKLRKN
jgi:hypothetical protein